MQHEHPSALDGQPVHHERQVLTVADVVPGDLLEFVDTRGEFDSVQPVEIIATNQKIVGEDDKIVKDVREPLKFVNDAYYFVIRYHGGEKDGLYTNFGWITVGIKPVKFAELGVEDWEVSGRYLRTPEE